MTHKQAQTLMAKGGKVRAKDWPPEAYIYMIVVDEQGDELAFNDLLGPFEEYKPSGNGISWALKMHFGGQSVTRPGGVKICPNENFTPSCADVNSREWVLC